MARSHKDRAGRTVSDDRPRNRLDCADEDRPCPFVGCRFHLAIEVNEETGTMTSPLMHRGLKQRDDEDYAEAWMGAVADAIQFMPYSCAWDAAAEGPRTLDEVGDLMARTRERTRQIEVRGLVQLRRPMKKDGWHEHEPADAAGPAERMRRAGGTE